MGLLRSHKEYMSIGHIPFVISSYIFEAFELDSNPVTLQALLKCTD